MQAQALRTRVAAIDNRASEEVVGIFARLLEGAARPSALPPWRDAAPMCPARALA